MGFAQPSGGYFMPAVPQPQRFFNPAQANIRGAQTRWPQQPRGGQAQMMGMQGGFRGHGPRGPRMNQNAAAAAAAAAAASGMRPMGGQQMMPMMTARPGMPPQQMQQMQAPPRPQNFKYTQGVRRGTRCGSAGSSSPTRWEGPGPTRELTSA